ncbi:hypothetical protein RBA38_23250, partial [Mycobacteroides abscessus subsp. abscessus]|uniref:hypothetical protein n=1 Tax=Mycobacteroides abscessus TaxID=36809 RepID=UPI003CF9BBAC
MSRQHSPGQAWPAHPPWNTSDGYTIQPPDWFKIRAFSSDGTAALPQDGLTCYRYCPRLDSVSMARLALED